jgi:hypothetical protein
VSSCIVGSPDIDVSYVEHAQTLFFRLGLYLWTDTHAIQVVLSIMADSLEASA